MCAICFFLRKTGKMQKKPENGGGNQFFPEKQKMQKKLGK